MKIYELNLRSIEYQEEDKDYFMNGHSYAQRMQFFDDNEELISICKNFLKYNCEKKIYVKYKNEYYFLKKEKATNVCKNCDFAKTCQNVSACLTDMLFGRTIDINLRKIQLYEIVFSNENTEKEMIFG